MYSTISSGTFTSLKFRDFRYIWIGVILMMGGMNMAGIARGYLTYEITSSPILLGIVNSGFAVPMLLFALFGGAIADRLKKKRIMQICQFIGAAAALFVAVSITTGSVTWIHLFIASIVNGVIFAFLVPARTAMIPTIVSQEHTANALALSAGAMSTMTLLAPALAGNLYSIIGADGVYYTVSALYIISIVLTGLIHGGNEVSTAQAKPVMHQIAAGFRYIGNHKIIIVLLTVGLSTALLSFPFRSLLPIYVVDVFKRGPESLGLLVTVMGIGAVIGSFGIASLGRRKRGKILLAGGLFAGAAMVIASIVPLYGVVAICLLIMGFGDAIRRSLVMALIMEQTDPELQGPVSSVYTMNFGLMPLGTLPASALTQAFSVQAATGIFGIILVILLLVVAITQRRLRELS